MAKQGTRIYSATYLAEALGVDRDTVNRAIKSGRVEEPAYWLQGAGDRTPIAGWTKEQVARIKREWTPGKPGRPTGGAVPPTPTSRKGRKR